MCDHYLLYLSTTTVLRWIAVTGHSEFENETAWEEDEAYCMLATAKNDRLPTVLAGLPLEYLLCYNGHQRRGENVHVLWRWSICAVQTRIQLMIQLIEMAKIQSAIKGPAAWSQAAWFPFYNLQTTFTEAWKKVLKLEYIRSGTSI